MSLAKPPHDSRVQRLLVVELWGIGDLALALPFLRSASEHAETTLLAKAHAAPLLALFAPRVRLVVVDAPWTAFSAKYRFHRWPWRALAKARAELRETRFDVGVSARPDPRDHILLALAGARRRLGFSRAGSHLLLSEAVTPPTRPHRAEYWRALGTALGLPVATTAPGHRRGRRVVIHAGAGHPVRIWPRERFDELAARLRAAGWEVTLLDGMGRDLNALLDTLAGADRFIGNDSGPGHLAAVLGVPTFTIFGPQLPELFAPQHPAAAWIEGQPCPYKPCFDACRFPAPNCIRDISLAAVWARLQSWLVIQ